MLLWYFLIMARISKIEEVKDRYAGAAEKIASRWFKARDEQRFYENWKKKLEELGAKVGPVTEKRYKDGVLGVSKETFEKRVKEAADRYYRNYLAGLAV